MRSRSIFNNYIGEDEKELLKITEYQDLLEMKEKKYKRKKSNFKREYRRKYS